MAIAPHASLGPGPGAGALLISGVGLNASRGADAAKLVVGPNCSANATAISAEGGSLASGGEFAAPDKGQKGRGGDGEGFEGSLSRNKGLGNNKVIESNNFGYYYCLVWALFLKCISI
jgi:hypothetical protein